MNITMCNWFSKHITVIIINYIATFRLFFFLQNIADYVNKQYLYKVDKLSLKTRGWTGELLKHLCCWKWFSMRNRELQPGQWRRSREAMSFLITEGDIWHNMHSQLRKILGIFTIRFVVVHNKMHMMHESVCNVTYIN